MEKELFQLLEKLSTEDLRKIEELLKINIKMNEDTKASKN